LLKIYNDIVLIVYNMFWHEQQTSSPENHKRQQKIVNFRAKNK